VLLDKVLAINPNLVSSLSSKGTVLYFLGNHTEAIQYCDKH